MCAIRARTPFAIKPDTSRQEFLSPVPEDHRNAVERGRFPRPRRAVPGLPASFLHRGRAEELIAVPYRLVPLSPSWPTRSGTSTPPSTGRRCTMSSRPGPTPPAGGPGCGRTAHTAGRRGRGRVARSKRRRHISRGACSTGRTIVLAVAARVQTGPQLAARLRQLRTQPPVPLLHTVLSGGYTHERFTADVAATRSGGGAVQRDGMPGSASGVVLSTSSNRIPHAVDGTDDIPGESPGWSRRGASPTIRRQGCRSVTSRWAAVGRFGWTTVGHSWKAERPSTIRPTIAARCRRSETSMRENGSVPRPVVTEVAAGSGTCAGTPAATCRSTVGTT